MKRKLCLAVLAALAAPASAPAIEHAISGHVNRMIRFADDGKASEIQQLDSDHSRTRIRWRGNGDIGRGMRAGIYIETAVASSRSSVAPIKLDGDGTDATFAIRHSALSFSGKWGQIRLGNTSEVLDGAAQADLSGDTLAMWSEAPEDNAGGIAWRTSDGGVITGAGCPATGCAVVDTRRDFDGDRVNLLRYDSPSLGPVSVSAAVFNDNAFDIGAELTSTLGGGKLLVRGAFSKEDQRGGYNQWATSGSYLFSQGTSFTFSLGGRDLKGSGDDPINYWFKLGHKWGNNALSIGGGQTEDLLTKGANSWDVGVGFVHTIPKPGVELYAAFHHLELDLDSTAESTLAFSGSSTSTEEINVFMVGSRIRFN